MASSKNVWKPVAIAAICIIAAESVCYGMGLGWKDKDNTSSDSKSESSSVTETTTTTTTAAVVEPAAE